LIPQSITCKFAEYSTNIGSGIHFNTVPSETFRGCFDARTHGSRRSYEHWPWNSYYRIEALSLKANDFAEPLATFFFAPFSAPLPCFLPQSSQPHYFRLKKPLGQRCEKSSPADFKRGFVRCRPAIRRGTEFEFVRLPSNFAKQRSNGRAE
jgi:hypothetical protein